MKGRRREEREEEKDGRVGGKGGRGGRRESAAPPQLAQKKWKVRVNHAWGFAW